MSHWRLLLVGWLSSLAIVSGSHAAVSQTIYAWFDVDGNLNLRYVDNSAVGTTIPPGTYQVILNNNTADDYAVDHVFHLFGPGVDYKPPAGAVQTSFSVTFQTGGTYTVQDDLDPKDIHQTIVATNSPGATSAATTSTATSSGSTPAATNKKPTSSDIVGSQIMPFRGALDAIVYASGKLTLSRNGKKVTSLKTGKYTFSVDDESKKSGFSVQVLHGKTSSITSATFVGSQDVTIPLKPGRWFFFSPGGSKVAFFVIS
jgi:hypothetical protein